MRQGGYHQEIKPTGTKNLFQARIKMFNILGKCENEKQSSFKDGTRYTRLSIVQVTALPALLSR